MQTGIANKISSNRETTLPHNQYTQPASHAASIIFTTFQTKKENGGTEVSEQQESLAPIGIEDAPALTQEYRKTLEESKNIPLMKKLQKLVSYNSDSTINILPLKLTFCRNINGQCKGINYDEAQRCEGEDSEGYTLMTDYNEGAPLERKQQTDFYKIISLFSPLGEAPDDTEKARELFRYMTGCNGMYWTATTFESRGVAFPNLACVRIFFEGKYHKNACLTYSHNFYHACGIKKMHRNTLSRKETVG